MVFPSNSYTIFSSSVIIRSFLYKIKFDAGFDGDDKQVIFADWPCFNGKFGNNNLGWPNGGTTHQEKEFMNNKTS